MLWFILIFFVVLMLAIWLAENSVSYYAEQQIGYEYVRNDNNVNKS